MIIGSKPAVADRSADTSRRKVRDLCDSPPKDTAGTPARYVVEKTGVVRRLGVGLTAL
jgi:hypothetical protein